MGHIHLSPHWCFRCWQVGPFQGYYISGLWPKAGCAQKKPMTWSRYLIWLFSDHTLEYANWWTDGIVTIVGKRWMEAAQYRASWHYVQLMDVCRLMMIYLLFIVYIGQLKLPYLVWTDFCHVEMRAVSCDGQRVWIGESL